MQKRKRHGQCLKCVPVWPAAVEEPPPPTTRPPSCDSDCQRANRVLMDTCGVRAQDGGMLSVDTDAVRSDACFEAMSAAFWPRRRASTTDASSNALQDAMEFVQSPEQMQDAATGLLDFTVRLLEDTKSKIERQRD